MAYRMSEMAEGHPAKMPPKERGAFFNKIKELSMCGRRGERTGAVDIPSVAPPMSLKVRFAETGSLCMYSKRGLESGVLDIVDSMVVGGAGMCMSDKGVNKPGVKDNSGSKNGCSISDRRGNGGVGGRSIGGDSWDSEVSSGQGDEMVPGVNRQWVEGDNHRRGTVDSGREMVVNAVRKDGAGWEAIVVSPAWGPSGTETEAAW